MNKYLDGLTKIGGSMSRGGNLFFLACNSGNNSSADGLPHLLGNMMLKSNININVWRPMGLLWAGAGKREIRFGDKGVSTIPRSGWTVVSKAYLDEPHQTAGVVRFHKTGKNAFTFTEK
jgi:hypothetical protein